MDILENSLNIYIYNPSLKTGGTNNLLANVASLLANDGNLNVYYIDYKNSPVAKIVLKSNPRIIFIDYNDKDIISISSGILISTLLEIKIIPEKLRLSEKTRLILWSTHPDDGLKIIPTFNLWLRWNIVFSRKIALILHPFFKKRIQKFLRVGIDNLGIVWMDDENFNANNLFYTLKRKPVILPIFTKNPENNNKLDKLSSSNNLKLVVLGRLTDFKIRPLYGLIQQIADYIKNTTKTVRIDFIGDGRYKNLVENWLINNDIKNYNFLGHIDISDLDNKLMQYDLLIGMATSTLEGAKLHLPSVIIDASYKILNKERVKLRWLYEVEPFHVCRIVGNNKQYEGRSFSNLMKDIDSNAEKQEVGLKCFEHWQSYHSPDSINSLIKHTIDNNTFYFSEENQSLLKRDYISKITDLLKKHFK